MLWPRGPAPCSVGAVRAAALPALPAPTPPPSALTGVHRPLPCHAPADAPHHLSPHLAADSSRAPRRKMYSNLKMKRRGKVGRHALLPPSRPAVLHFFVLMLLLHLRLTPSPGRDGSGVARRAARRVGDRHCDPQPRAAVCLRLTIGGRTALYSQP